jgi:hypothetical protein
MSIPEPSSPLWAAVKAVYDSWPPDDETVAQQLGDSWRRGVDEWARAATGTADAGTAAHAVWMDSVGASFNGRLGEASQTMDELQQQMQTVGVRGDRYAQALVAAKTAITSNIAANEANYALLGSPLFGAMGPALQQGFATQIAHNLKAMIAERAAALSSGEVPMAPKPVPVPRPAPPPAPAPPPPQEDDGWSWSDIGHGILDGIGLVPVVGEWADGANAAWYASQGDWVNAGLSAAAMVPVAGWLSTTGKYSFMAVRSIDGAQAWAKNRPSAVPWNAARQPFSSNAKFKDGFKYTWTDKASGKQMRYHAHGIDPSRPVTDNAGKGPIYRVKVGNKHYLDGAGNKHAKNSVEKPNSPSYNEEAVNDTHIPYPSTQPPPGDHSYQRIAAPNPAALLGPDGEEK